LRLAHTNPRPSCRWSAYGGYQKFLWNQLDRRRGFSPAAAPRHEGPQVVGVQAAAALMGGCTSAVLTNPLDVVKTRLQVPPLPPAAFYDDFRGSETGLLSVLS